MRVTQCLIFVVLVAAAYGLYLVKWEVRSLKLENGRVASALAEEKRALGVLDAEWAYMNRPDRLRRMATLHLQLDSLSGEQFADIAQIGLDVQGDDESKVTGKMGTGTVLSTYKKY